MIVVDNSAVVDALVAYPIDRRLSERLSAEDELHAPHVVDLELLQTLRRLLTAGVLPADRAADVRHSFDALRIVRYRHAPLADRVWQLRHNLTAYDAVYVALAEVLGATLVTTDARMAHAPGHEARIELFTAGQS